MAKQKQHLTLRPGKWDNPPPVWLLILGILALGAVSLAFCFLIFYGFPKDMFSRRKNKMPVKGRTVLITGGSQGMGLELGNVFSSKGANVVLVARSSAKLEKAVQYIKQSASDPDTQRFHWISADVTDPAENDRLLAEATDWNHGAPPDIVWANAGAAVPGYFLELSVETMRKQMDLNYWAAIYLSKSVFKAWLNTPVKAIRDAEGQHAKPLSRHFVMTSSVASFCGLAGYTGYAPAKAAMRSFHDQMRSELQLYNGYLGHPSNKTIPQIKIHTVFPGTIDSPGLDQENTTKPPILKILEDGDPVQKPLEIAQEAIRQLEKGRSLITTNILGHVMKVAGLQGSMRDDNFRDTVLSWIASVAWVFIAPDMERKVRKWGQQNGMSLTHE